VTNHADRSLVQRVRQNHALEHATLHALSRRQPGLRLVGRSDWTGFWLYGDVDRAAVAASAREGLLRLQSGESWLAIHPRCGSSIAASMLMGGALGMLIARVFPRSPWARALSGAVAALGVLASGPALGLAVQRHLTTTGEVEGLRIAAIARETRGNLVIHHVRTA
jgi:hypothetical protein